MDGPPDVTHLPRKEGLEVLRSYRKQKEMAKEYDFSLGPPNVAELEGPERLAVLRKYRQWLQARDEAFEAPPTAQKPAGTSAAKRDDIATPRERPAASVAPWLKGQSPTVPPLDISDDMGGGGVPPTASKTAGLVSGAHGSMYSYFERPITARDSSRVAPTVESKPADDPSPRRDPAAEAALRAEALEGAAGMQSNAVSTTAWLGAWLEADTPRNCRKLLPKDGAFDETKTNIFAPEAQPDEKQGEYVTEYTAASQMASADYFAGGMPPPTPRATATAEMPSTVGMSRAMALETKRQWRLTLQGQASQPPTPRAGGPVAGMSSEYRSRTVRGHVGSLDPSAAAEYNLQVKLAKGSESDRSLASGTSTPRMQSSVAPWLEGGERMVFPPPAAAPAAPDISDATGAAARLSSAPFGTEAALPPAVGAPPAGVATPRGDFEGLSHAEKLRRMRELRQASMGGPDTPRASMALA